MPFLLFSDLVNVSKSVLAKSVIAKFFLQKFSSDLVNVFTVYQIASFRDVGISLNIDESEDHQMKFQGHERGLPSDIIIG